MAVHVLTDKPDNKQLPCTYPGCEDEIVVNKFYAPAKARCPEHSGKTTPAAYSAVSPHPYLDNGARQAPKVNHNLGDLRCPICGAHMTVVRVDEEMGWPTLRCPSPCSTAVEIKPSWAPLIMNTLPSLGKPMLDLLEALNVEQRSRQEAHVNHTRRIAEMWLETDHSDLAEEPA